VEGSASKLNTKRLGRAALGWCVAVDTWGNVYVVEHSSNCIEKVTATGRVSDLSIGDLILDGPIGYRSG